MNKKETIKSILRAVIFITLGLGLVFWKYSTLDMEAKNAMSDSFKNIQWFWLIPIFIIGFLSHFFRAIRWKQILEPMEIKPSTANITLSVLIGYLGNTIIPRFGEVLKCTVLAKYEKVSVDKLVGTIIAERAFDLVTLLMVFGITFWIEFSTILPFADGLKVSFLNFVEGLSLLKTILIITSLIVLFIVFIKIILPKIRSSKIGEFIIGIKDGLQSIFHIKRPVLFIFNSIMIWVCYTLMAYLGFYAIPGLSHLSFMAALAVIAFGSIAMIITPGGVGAYPVIVSQLLVLYGISEGLGMAYGWVSWGAQTIIVILLGLASLALLPMINKQK